MENKFDLIEKYLMNEMSVREQVEFENLLRTNPDLMKEFLLRKNVNNAIIEDDVISLREELNKIIDQPAYIVKPKRSLYFYSSVAAVIILFIVSSILFLHPNKRVNKTDIFQSYYSAYPVTMSFRSSMDQSDTEKIMYNAFNYYNEEQYDSASKYFKLVFEEDKTNYMCQFYLALCEIEKNNLNKAEEYLEDLILNKNNIFWEQSNWYLALVYLKQNKIDSAENILKKIIQEDMSQRSDAESILKILN